MSSPSPAQTPAHAPARAGQAAMPVGVVGPGVERVMPAHVAEQRALAAIGGLGLRARVRRLGAHGGLASWSCELVDASGQRAPKGQGSGKGCDEDARVGAVFEALEHYLTGPARFDPSQVVFHPGAELAAGALSGEASAPVLAATPRVACLPHTPLAQTTPAGRRTHRLPVPLALGTSWYLDNPELRRAAGDDTDYRALTRYGTNNGSAIGTTVGEAVLHGLNELIERDALSLLLGRCFLAPTNNRGAGGNGSGGQGGEGYRLRVVDPASLPAQLAAAHRTAREVIGAPVWLLHATTDLGVPTFFAYTTNSVHSEGRFGGGASLHPRYATLRALSELVQMRLATNAHPEAVHPTSLTALGPYPPLRAAGEADLTGHLTRAEHIAFPDTNPDADPGGQTPTNVDTQVQAVVARMTAAGYPPYHRVIAELPEGVVAVRVFAPGLERFMSVLCGFLLLPGPRIRGAAHSVGVSAGVSR